MKDKNTRIIFSNNEGLVEGEIDDSVKDKPKISVEKLLNTFFIKKTDGVEMMIGNIIIGYITYSCFTDNLNGINSSDHLAKYILPSCRGKGYGILLMEEFIRQGFTLPPFEYTQKKSIVALSKKFGYEVISYYQDGNEHIITEKLPYFLEDKDYPVGVTIKLKKTT